MALCDRFQQLLKGPSSVTAAKQNTALFGVSGNESELSLRIGEAQQIYPEIWRHLDDARAAIASRGVTVAQYDALRTAEGPGLGANVQTSYSEVAGRHGHARTTKDANFNREGLQRARSACKALMDAIPEVDWAAIAKAEANDPAAAAFRRATRNRRYMMFGALALVIASPFLYVMWQQHQENVKREERRRAWDSQHSSSSTVTSTPLPAAESAELTARVAKLKTAYDAALQSWAATTSTEALAAIKPATQPCERQVLPPSQAAADAFIETNDVDLPAFASSDFRAYEAAAPIPAQPLLAAQRVLDGLSRALTTRAATASDKALLADVPLDYLFVLIDRNVEPEITATAPMTYKPGNVTARGYLYSVLSGKVTCAATIDAKNPPPSPLPPFLSKARRAPEARDALHRHLEVAIRQELAANLRATVP